MRDEFEDYGSAHFELATNHEQLGSCVHDASLAVNPSPSQSAVDLQEHSSPSLSATALLVHISNRSACLLCGESF